MKKQSLTCEDCVLHDMCVIVENSANKEDYLSEFGCEIFKNRHRTFELPCDVGDTVYCLIDENNELDSESTHICTSTVEGFSIEKHCDRHMLVIHLDFWDTDINPRTLIALADDCINNTVFIHLQDARKAISERRA